MRLELSNKFVNDIIAKNIKRILGKKLGCDILDLKLNKFVIQETSDGLIELRLDAEAVSTKNDICKMIEKIKEKRS